jgi:phosphate transport system protein
MTAPKQKPGYRHFHDELAQLKQRLLDMSGQAERLVELAIKSLLERDRDVAEEVIAGDKKLNEMEVEIEQLSVRMLALQQPMARDLRFLVGAIKVSSDLERVGDHAVNIAEGAVRLIDHKGRLTPGPALEDMARRARTMLSDALDAFLRADGALGREVCIADDAVDTLHDSVFRVMLTHMMESSRNIGPALELLLVSRNLERVADLATNIGEDAVYLAEGKQIKHHFED